jgi:DNA-binding CsgD family transcriptional regulator
MGEPLGVAPYLIEAYVALGRQDDAIAVAEQFAAVTPATAPPWLRALAARCRGLSAADDETAVHAYETALAAHADAPDTFETAPTHLLYGARLRRSGQRVKAREQLRTAQDAFAEMDLTVWVLRAADELAATGARLRSRRPQPTEPLTSQETRVALHAAKGMSNKEIAAALFLSPKTVEHHLSSATGSGVSAPARSSPDHSVRARTADLRRYPNTRLMNTAAGKPARLGQQRTQSGQTTMACPDPQPLTEQWPSRYSMNCMHCDGMGTSRK